MIKSFKFIVFFILFLQVVASVVAFKTQTSLKKKSIVFDPNTPDVFYCFQDKPSANSKTIVRARPIEKLCEFGGLGLKRRPKNEEQDCYNDLDETDYACEEKKRIQVRLDLSKINKR